MKNGRICALADFYAGRGDHYIRPDEMSRVARHIGAILKARLMK